MRKNISDNSKKSNICIALLLFLIIIMVLVLFWGLKEKGMFTAAEMEETEKTEGASGAEASNTEKWQEGIISYNGKKYRYNTSIKAYLFMGIDKEGTVAAAEDGISGGQSDAMFLLVINPKIEKISIVSINRNAMTMVDVYDREGNYLEQRKLPICLQHGYGDGMRTSCLRTVDAVSRMLYGIPISGYLSLNMEAMPILNDAVGGVTVDVMEDLENKSLGVSLKAGETVTLNGNEAYVYLRSRDTNEFDSATKRLERQNQYLVSLIAKIKNTALAEESSILQIYDSVEAYMVTNMDFVKLAEDAVEYEFDRSQMYTIPGETYMGMYYEEYYIDEDALYEMMIDVFYEQV